MVKNSLKSRKNHRFAENVSGQLGEYDTLCHGSNSVFNFLMSVRAELLYAKNTAMCFQSTQTDLLAVNYCQTAFIASMSIWKKQD
jgi:hypothetical protein